MQLLIVLMSPSYIFSGLQYGYLCAPGTAIASSSLHHFQLSRASAAADLALHLSSSHPPRLVGYMVVLKCQHCRDEVQYSTCGLYMAKYGLCLLKHNNAKQNTSTVK